MKSGSLIFLCYVIAIAAAATLQWFPLTGIVLMFFMGPLWISVLANLMMLHIGFCAFAGIIERMWLVLPTIIYGFWLSWVAYGNFAVSRQISKIESENRITETVPSTLPLVFDSKAEEFAVSVKKYLKGGAVFTLDREIQVTQANDCASLEVLKAGWKFHGYFLAKPDYDLPRTCAMSKTAEPPHDAIFFVTENESIATRSGDAGAKYVLERRSPNSPPRVIGQFAMGFKSAPSLRMFDPGF